LQPGHVTQRMRNVLCGLLHRENAGLAYIGPLRANILVILAVRKKVSWSRTTYRGKKCWRDRWRHVT